jgi:uncharacterized protein
MLRLIIFARYPEPGHTKTRLIPALGAVGAASFQGWMTEQVLGAVAPWQATESTLKVQVQYAGGTLAQLRSWLGHRWDYQPQGAGDLGDRMQAAFVQAFAQGAERVVLIGTDCLAIDPTCLRQAYELLQRRDLVLGPAQDGGYYLIGLRRPCPELFGQMSWSTATVLTETLARATVAGRSIGLLGTQRDLDEPADLQHWVQSSIAMARRAIAQKADRAQKAGQPNDPAPSPPAPSPPAPSPPAPSPPGLSVIIPARNEAANLARTLAALLTHGNSLEVIVVDGDSEDDTVAIAQAFGARVLRTKPGRAAQQNLGAQMAQFDRLLFLHADTQVPPGFQSAIDSILAQPNNSLGAFELAIRGSNWQQLGGWQLGGWQLGGWQLGGWQPSAWKLRAVEWGVRVRSHSFKLPYGDQGLFLRRETFDALGGFQDWPILEDLDLVQRAQQFGNIAIAPLPVTTSARRWEKLGWGRTTWINQKVLLGYAIGLPLDQLRAWYRQG